MAKKAVVILAPGFEGIEAITVIEVLRRSGVEVVTAGIGSGTVKCSSGVPVVADARIEEITDTPDAVVLPGGVPGAENLGNTEAAKKLAEKVAAAGGICAAICASPALALGKWGLLEGKKAVCFPLYRHLFPDTVTQIEEQVVVDGKFITSLAPSTSLPFALTVARALTDDATVQPVEDRLKGNV
ncbi:MAG: DJ-1/PfpI family protein [Planctomycetes bacterium]|nr:DJ-1/PfpI family protein [Planctomycetota bacterium]